VPVGFGWHPYFATPEGTAYILHSSIRKIEGLLNEPLLVPLSEGFRRGSRHFYTVEILVPGLGTTKMTFGGDFLKAPAAMLVLWRDDERYLCVEPVIAQGRDFGTKRCLWLKPGEYFYTHCSFEFRRKE
jgi:galactose mutarotase-like enzyme